MLTAGHAHTHGQVNLTLIFGGPYSRSAWYTTSMGAGATAHQTHVRMCGLTIGASGDPVEVRCELVWMEAALEDSRRHWDTA